MQAPEPLLRAQNIANILDMAVKIPFVGIRVGLDFLIGLIPVIGDATMLIASLRIVQLGRQLGVPKDIQHKMLTNSFLDFGLGFIPLVGDIFDLFFKANVRNVRLMERWWIENNKERVDEHAKQVLVQWTEEFESDADKKTD